LFAQAAQAAQALFGCASCANFVVCCFLKQKQNKKGGFSFLDEGRRR